VLVSNEAIYAFSSENGGDLNPKDFSVRISEESVVSPPPGVGGLLKQLHAVTPAERLRLQAGVARAAWCARWLLLLLLLLLLHFLFFFSPFLSSSSRFLCVCSF